MEKRAEAILSEMGLKMAQEIKEDRVRAFENYAEALMLNQYVIAASRIMSLDTITRFVKDIHIMIGAPKKKTEGVDEEPLALMQQWLHGKIIPGFPLTPEMVEEELEEGLEEADAG